MLSAAHAVGQTAEHTGRRRGVQLECLVARDAVTAFDAFSDVPDRHRLPLWLIGPLHSGIESKNARSSGGARARAAPLRRRRCEDRRVRAASAERQGSRGDSVERWGSGRDRASSTPQRSRPYAPCRSRRPPEAALPYLRPIASGRPDQNAHTKGSPVKVVHSAPRSIFSAPMRSVVSKQRQVAYEERRVSCHQHRGQIGRMLDERGRNPEPPGAENSDERDRRSGRCVERDTRHFAERLAGKDRDRPDGTIGPDADPRHEPIGWSVEPGDRRNHAEIDRSLVEKARAVRRHVEAQRDRIRAPLEAIDERPDVQVADRAKSNRTCHDSRS